MTARTPPLDLLEPARHRRYEDMKHTYLPVEVRTDLYTLYCPVNNTAELARDAKSPMMQPQADRQL